MPVCRDGDIIPKNAHMPSPHEGSLQPMEGANDIFESRVGVAQRWPQGLLFDSLQRSPDAS